MVRVIICHQLNTKNNIISGSEVSRLSVAIHMRYELGVDAGYTFTYSEDQALTPYFKLAYVYDDSNNDNDVNGDSIDNGTEGSAVRVGLGTQFSFTKNFSAYTDANYLGGGDVDQDWSANVGVKYTW